MKRSLPANLNEQCLLEYLGKIHQGAASSSALGWDDRHATRPARALDRPGGLQAGNPMMEFS